MALMRGFSIEGIPLLNVIALSDIIIFLSSCLQINVFVVVVVLRYRERFSVMYHFYSLIRRVRISNEFSFYSMRQSGRQHTKKPWISKRLSKNHKLYLSGSYST